MCGQAPHEHSILLAWYTCALLVYAMSRNNSFYWKVIVLRFHDNWNGCDDLFLLKKQNWQRGRFEEQMRQHNEKHGSAVSGTDSVSFNRKKDEDDSYEVTLDDDFLTALEYGMPPASGLVCLSFLSVHFSVSHFGWDP